jgi:hypothetical protein
MRWKMIRWMIAPLLSITMLQAASAPPSQTKPTGSSNQNQPSGSANQTQPSSPPSQTQPSSSSGPIQPSRTLNTFTFDCASPDALKAAHLEAAARQALDSLGDSGAKNWADRAVAVDLNGDGSPELFVPLSCGATCNCTWGIFQQTPPQQLGIIGACVLHIQRISKPWATVLAYSAMSEGDGFLQSYSWEKGSYRGGPLTEVKWPEASSKLDCENSEHCCK